MIECQYLNIVYDSLINSQWVVSYTEQVNFLDKLKIQVAKKGLRQKEYGLSSTNIPVLSLLRPTQGLFEVFEDYNFVK